MNAVSLAWSLLTPLPPLVFQVPSPCGDGLCLKQSFAFLRAGSFQTLPPSCQTMRVARPRLWQPDGHVKILPQTCDWMLWSSCKVIFKSVVPFLFCWGPVGRWPSKRARRRAQLVDCPHLSHCRQVPATAHDSGIGINDLMISNEKLS